MKNKTPAQLRKILITTKSREEGLLAKNELDRREEMLGSTEFLLRFPKNKRSGIMNFFLFECRLSKYEKNNLPILDKEAAKNPREVFQGMLRKWKNAEKFKMRSYYDRTIEISIFWGGLFKNIESHKEEARSLAWYCISYVKLSEENKAKYRYKESIKRKALSNATNI